MFLLGRVNAGRGMCVGKLHLLIFTWTTWLMSRSLNSTPGPLLRRLLTYHSFQLEEQRNAKNVPTFCFKSALALYALRTCRWPPKARLVCGLALARPQLRRRTINEDNYKNYKLNKNVSRVYTLLWHSNWVLIFWCKAFQTLWHKHKQFTRYISIREGTHARKRSFARSYAYVYAAPGLHSCKCDISISIIKWTRFLFLMVMLMLMSLQVYTAFAYAFGHSYAYAYVTV